MPTCGNYKLRKKLGEGGFGAVYLAKHIDSGEKVALKIIKNEMMEYISMDDIEKEVDVLKQLDHLHITRHVESGYADLTSRGKSNRVYFIALEVAAGGELFDFISITGGFDESIARYFFHQFIEGLEYLHEQGFSHRDLKTENILLDKKYRLKIADFGYASSKTANQTQVGTEDYMAPEILSGQDYSGKVADMFGAGLILFMMVAQSKAFLKASSSDAYYKYLTSNRPDKFWREHAKNKGDESYFSEEYQSMVNGLFAYNPTHRLSISEVKAHPWYNGPMMSEDDIISEFNRRKEELEEEQRRQKDENPAEHEFNAAVFEGKIRRDITGEEEVKEGEVEREVLEYDSEFKKYTQFFSTSKLEDLWNTLAVYINIVSSDYKFTAEDYSVTAKLIPISEEEKEEVSPIEFTVNILKVEDQDKYCVEGVMLNGDQFKFANQFKNMQKFFAGHANASETS